MVVLDRFFFIWGTKKLLTVRIRLVVLAYRKDCLRIGLGGLNLGGLRQVEVL